jgi:hypothetical protein
VDDHGNAIDVDDLGVKDKVMHKSKSKLVNSFKGLSKRVAAIGADVTVDGVRKKVRRVRCLTARADVFCRSEPRSIASCLAMCSRTMAMGNVGITPSLDDPR